MILLVAQTHWLLNQSLTLSGHIRDCLVAHEGNVAITVGVPLPVVVGLVDHVGVTHHLLAVVNAVGWLHGSRACGHKGSGTTHLPVYGFVLHNLLLKLLLLQVHLVVELPKDVGVDLQSLTAHLLVLLVQHVHVRLLGVYVLVAEGARVERLLLVHHVVVFIEGLLSVHRILIIV